MKRVAYLIVAITLVLVYTGCSSKKPAPVAQEAKPLPIWYTQPQENDNETLYAVSSGTSSDEAVKRALTEMISKLSVNVESTFNKEVDVKRLAGGSLVKEQLKSSLKTEVAKIEISNYEIVHNEKIDFRHYIAMVKANKAKLVHTLKNSLQAKMQSIDITLKSLHDVDVFKQLKGYETSYLQAKALTAYIMVIGELESGFDVEGHLAYINNIYNRYSTLKNSIAFYIDAQDKHNELFGQKLKNALSKEYAVVVKPASHALNVRCEVSTRTEDTGLGFLIAVYNVKLGVFEKDRKIAGNTVVVKTRIKENDQATMERAVISFEKEVTQQGIMALLGVVL